MMLTPGRRANQIEMADAPSISWAVATIDSPEHPIKCRTPSRLRISLARSRSAAAWSAERKTTARSAEPSPSCLTAAPHASSIAVMVFEFVEHAAAKAICEGIGLAFVVGDLGFDHLSVILDR